MCAIPANSLLFVALALVKVLISNKVDRFWPLKKIKIPCLSANNSELTGLTRHSKRYCTHENEYRIQ